HSRPPRAKQIHPLLLTPIPNQFLVRFSSDNQALQGPSIHKSTSFRHIYGRPSKWSGGYLDGLDIVTKIVW
ncbi:hypothetical protein AVEN_21133-1, partial [Araneus ventricosus]